MKKVFADRPIHPEGLAVLQGRPEIVVEILREHTRAMLAHAVATGDAIMLFDGAVDAKMLEAATNLRIISRVGVGFDRVDVQELTRRGIALAVAGDANADAVAEHALFLMLAAAKQAMVMDREARRANFEVTLACTTTELWGKTVVLVGHGRIGKRVARLCAAFGMDVLVFDPFAPKAGNAVFVSDLMAALPQADYVSLHLPLTAESRGSFGVRQIAAMKPGAIFVNVSRGPLVDQGALYDALRSGAIRAAGLDVLVDEPPRPDEPILQLENVVLSPHNAGSTYECMGRMTAVAARNILAAFDGTLDPVMVINREILRGVA